MKKSRQEILAEDEERQQQIDEIKYQNYLREIDEQNKRERALAIVEALESDTFDTKDQTNGSSSSSSSSGNIFSNSPSVETDSSQNLIDEVVVSCRYIL